jgi:outer membrane protein TolC
MKRQLFTLFALLTSLWSNGQQPHTLTFEQALEITCNNNPSLKADDELLEAAKRNRQAAIGLFMPQIEIHGSWVHTQKDIAIDANPLKPLLGALNLPPLLNLDWRYTIQKRTFAFAEADVTIPLFTGGKIIAANRAAKIEEQSAKTHSAINYSHHFSELVERYFGVRLADNAVKVRELAVESLKLHLQQVEALYDNGMATNADILLVKYRLSNAQKELQTAIATQNTTHKALSTTMGIDGPIDSLITDIFITDEIEDVSMFIQMAAENSPQLQYINQQLGLAKQNVVAHRADFFPEVVALAGGGVTHQVSTLLPRWAIGIGLNFKLFDGLRREYKYMAAKATYNRVEQLNASAKSDITLLVESLYNTLTAHLANIVSTKQAVEFADEYLHYKQQAYLENMATTAEVIDATTQKAAAQIAHLEAAYCFDTTLAKLLEAAGESDMFLDYMNRSNIHYINYE